MPHCIIEYSEDLESTVSPETLINSVYMGALNSQLFSADDIKTRSISFKHFTSGAVKQNFIHVAVKILSGRTLEQRSLVSSSVLKELNTLPLISISLTVEVIEIEKESYSKVVK